VRGCVIAAELLRVITQEEVHVVAGLRKSVRPVAVIDDVLEVLVEVADFDVCARAHWYLITELNEFLLRCRAFLCFEIFLICDCRGEFSIRVVTLSLNLKLRLL